MSHKIKSSDFVVRNYRIGDENGIVSLLEHGFDGWSKFDLHCTTLERAYMLSTRNGDIKN